MDNTIIVLVIIGVLIIFFATKFLGAIARTIVKICLVLVVILAIVIVLFYRDIDELKTSISEKNNTFLLYEDGKLYAAITMMPAANKSYSLESFSYFNRTDMQELEKELNGNLLNATKEHRYFIIKPALLRSNYSLNITKPLDEKDITDILKSDDPYLVLAEKIRPDTEANISVIKQELLRAYGEPEILKGYLFAALLMNELQAANTNLITELKSKNLEILPETLSFRILRLVPFI